MDPQELLVKQLVAAFKRLRTLLLTSTLFCAFLLGNAYVAAFSIDDGQMSMAPALKRQLEDKLQAVKLTQMKRAPSAADLQEESRLEMRIARIDNSIKDYKLRTVSLPLIGLSMPSNDVDVVVGLFLAALAGWTLFAGTQIHDTLTGRDGQTLRPFFPALRHAAVLLRPPGDRLLRWSSRLVLCLPALTMAIVFAADALSVAQDRGVLDWPEMFTRVAVFTLLVAGILLWLAYAARRLLAMRKDLEATLFGEPQRPATGHRSAATPAHHAG